MNLSLIEPSDLARFEADAELVRLLVRAIRETPGTTAFVLRGSSEHAHVGYEWSGTGPDSRGPNRIGPKDNDALAALQEVLTAALASPTTPAATEEPDANGI